ncbi:hypothetical protein [Corynebacterium lactis]|nr:hypothetical protein [Corynebacterium lactis]
MKRMTGCCVKKWSGCSELKKFAISMSAYGMGSVPKPASIK